MKKTLTGAAVAVLLCSPVARAQDKAPEKPEMLMPPRKSVVPLKVRVVLSKLKGDTLTASLPYTLPCNAEDRPSHLRMGIEVPVMAASKDGPPAYQYKNVGTNIDCRAFADGEGRYRLEMTVEHSSVYAPPDDARRSGGDGTPMFRTFRSGFTPVLRDGQSLQYTTATDPVSGEVVKIDVTLTAMK
jgi:hypothetical protein